jgi:hypothetical protein
MEGRNYWEICIDRSPTAYLFVGVALRQANLSTFLGGDQHGWGYVVWSCFGIGWYWLVLVGIGWYWLVLVGRVVEYNDAN